ncbi:MAG: metallophosphoesterase, partial [Eubacteriales bacterium]|nr:metallophosphoesterase [Eubacteriales bacterium]
MKILILSDSHGNHEDIRRAIGREAPIDMLIHAGDVEGDLEQVLGVRREYEIRVVAGNMDWMPGLEQELCFPLGKHHRVFLTHGHRYGVYSGLVKLRERARRKKADLVIFGHTHKPEYERQGGITMINPGSISKPRQEGWKKTYVVMTVQEDGTMDVQFKSLP